jgi:hypothetical protein
MTLLIRAHKQHTRNVTCINVISKVITSQVFISIFLVFKFLQTFKACKLLSMVCDLFSSARASLSAVFILPCSAFKLRRLLRSDVYKMLKLSIL